MNFATKRSLPFRERRLRDFQANPVNFVATVALSTVGIVTVFEHASDGVRRVGVMLALLCLVAQNVWKKRSASTAIPVGAQGE